MDKETPLQDIKKNNNTQQESAIIIEEIGGYKGPEPTKYNDWQHKGRVTDF